MKKIEHVLINMLILHILVYVYYPDSYKSK